MIGQPRKSLYTCVDTKKRVALQAINLMRIWRVHWHWHPLNLQYSRCIVSSCLHMNRGGQFPVFDVTFVSFPTWNKMICKMRCVIHVFQLTNGCVNLIAIIWEACDFCYYPLQMAVLIAGFWNSNYMFWKNLWNFKLLSLHCVVWFEGSYWCWRVDSTTCTQLPEL